MVALNRALCVAAGALLLAATAWGQTQTKDQQKCINKMNKDGSKVQSARAQENTECVKRFGNGELTGVNAGEACLTSDLKQKIQKRRDKTTADETKFCVDAPGFGKTTALNVNDAAEQAELDLIHDVFGPAPIDNGLFACDPDVAQCVCQRNAVDRVEKLMTTMMAQFVKCKKATLKALATGPTALVACVQGPDPLSISADPAAKITERVSNLQTTLSEQCDTPGVATVSFPGECNGLGGMPLRDCLVARVRCRVCLMINDMDALATDCDLFDDGLANVSCP